MRFIFLVVLFFSNFSFADDQLHCLAKNIYMEARGEPLRGQLAVAYVTLNRARIKGTDICTVVYEPFQFSWTRRGAHSGYRAALPVALRALSAPPGVSKSTHFHSTKIRPPEWTKRLTKTKVIGNHVFYH